MKVAILIISDIVAFLVAVFLTYFAYASIQNVDVSLFVIQAHIKPIILVCFYFLAIQNLYGLYNLRRSLFDYKRLVLSTFTYTISLIVFSIVYPKYQFSRFLLFIDLTFIFFIVSLSRSILNRLMGEKR